MLKLTFRHEDEQFPGQKSDASWYEYDAQGDDWFWPEDRDDEMSNGWGLCIVSLEITGEYRWSPEHKLTVVRGFMTYATEDGEGPIERVPVWFATNDLPDDVRVNIAEINKLAACGYYQP